MRNKNANSGCVFLFAIPLVALGIVVMVLYALGISALLVIAWWPSVLTTAAGGGLGSYLVIKRKEWLKRSVVNQRRREALLSQYKIRVAVTLYVLLLFVGALSSMHVEWVDPDHYAQVYAEALEYEDDEWMMSEHMTTTLKTQSGWLWEAGDGAIMDEADMYFSLASSAVAAIMIFLLYSKRVLGVASNANVWEWMTRGNRMLHPITVYNRRWWRRFPPLILLVAGVLIHLALAYPGGRESPILQEEESGEYTYTENYIYHSYRPVWMNYQYDFRDYDGPGHVLKLLIIHFAFWYLCYLLFYRRANQRLVLINAHGNSTALQESKGML